MLTDKEAIEKAIRYFESLPQGLLGSPSNIRLESTRHALNFLFVTISYLADSKSGYDANAPVFQKPTRDSLGGFFKEVRYFKEIEVDLAKGEVKSMRDPEPHYREAV